MFREVDGWPEAVLCDLYCGCFGCLDGAEVAGRACSGSHPGAVDKPSVNTVPVPSPSRGQECTAVLAPMGGGRFGQEARITIS